MFGYPEISQYFTNQYYFHFVGETEGKVKSLLGKGRFLIQKADIE